jgi:hypothetical protein
VTAPTNRKRPGIHTHRCSTLTRCDITRHHGIRTTSPARTVLDIAPRITRRQLSQAVNGAEDAGWLRRHQVHEILARLPRAPGAEALRYVAGAGKIWSPLEYDFAGFAAKHGLPKPRTNVKIAGYTVDVLFEPEKVIVELDGWDYHRDRISFEDQRERDAATLQAGFVTIRLTWERRPPHRSGRPSGCTRSSASGGGKARLAHPKRGKPPLTDFFPHSEKVLTDRCSTAIRRSTESSTSTRR